MVWLPGYPVCIGSDGPAAHSDIEASYTATFSYPSNVRTKPSLLAAIPPPLVSPVSFFKEGDQPFNRNAMRG